MPFESMKLGGALLSLTILLILGACTDGGDYRINMMPSPEVYEEGTVDPFIGAVPIDEFPYDGMLYATDRKPATDGANQHYYLNERGNVLRLGIAQVELARHDVTWQDARRVSILKSSGKDFPIRISKVSEFGVLDRTATEFMPPEEVREVSRPANEAFAEKVNAKLARSRRKDVYIYVHGYRAIFENPTLVATELWHYLGYRGVFIAYAPRRAALPISEISTLRRAMPGICASFSSISPRRPMPNRYTCSVTAWAHE
jgi:hypothetical protein